MKRFAFTLDLEPEYAGLTQNREIFDYKSEIEERISRLANLGIKITVFVVGELFKTQPDIIKIFQKYNCEFELHSYSHQATNSSLEYEIKKAKQEYFDYFKKEPIGYRMPCGRITETGIKILERFGFRYDSSIFPSYYPNTLRYLFCKRNIHFPKNSSVMEIPLTSITPFRLTLSLSYLKLLGINFYLWLFRFFRLPDFICFNTHLHDFIVCEKSYSQLPIFWKFVYGRNKLSGIDYCVQFIKHIKQQEYQFYFMSEIYQLYEKRR